MTDKYVVLLDSRVVDGEAMDPSEAKQFQRYLNEVFPDRNYTIARLEPVEPEPEPDTYQEITFTIHAENTATWDEVLERLRDTYGLTLTELVRRAVLTYGFLEDQIAQGNRIQTVDYKRDEVRDLVLIF